MPRSLNRPTKRVIRMAHLAERPVRITKIDSDHEQITGKLGQLRISPGDSPTSTPAGTTTRPTPRAARQSRFSTQEIMVNLPAGEDLPPGGANLVIHTDDPDPRYAKLTVLITNERPQQRRRAPGTRPAVGRTSPGKQRPGQSPASRPTVKPAERTTPEPGGRGPETP